MDMQDKEFDESFRSKLDDFETEPSTNVWSGIAAELNTGKRKKTLMPWLSVAASIVVLVTAGILFVPKKTASIIKPQVNNNLVKTANAPAGIAPATINHLTGVKKSNAPARIKGVRATPKNKETSDIAGVKNMDTVISNKKPIKADEGQVMASLLQRDQEGTDAIVPDKGTVLVPKLTDMRPVAFNTKPALLANELPGISKKDSTPVKARHRIHSLGDLVNLVVAKIDKRKDKVIEFSDNDDNESNLVGVNLGIIKIKKGE